MGLDTLRVKTVVRLQIIALCFYLFLLHYYEQVSISMSQKCFVFWHF